MILNSIRPLILVAEDSDIIGLLIDRFLTAGDMSGLTYAVERVCNGCQAVEAATVKRYDLILMDVEMPELDGIEATRLILKDARHRSVRAVPIIGITADTDAAVIERGLSAGWTSYLNKPIHKQPLLEIVARTLGLAV